MKIASLFFFPRVATVIVVTALIILSASCSSDPDPQVPPQVTAISPTSGLTNIPVTIAGTNFSPVLAENKVTFNGKEAVVTLASATQLTATVPLLAETGPVSVVVKGLAAANQPIFTVETIPEVSNISPSSGPTNTSVIITGANFSIVLEENKVTFNGKEAVVTLATATQLTATVPLLAETGPVIVTVKGRTASNQPTYTVETIPAVSNISPSSGPTNTSVFITGTNFSIVLAENKVTFNGKDAVVTVATATQLTTTVPLLAETGPVIVIVKGKTATNQPIFTVQETDKLRLAMSSSLSAYDAAAANTWIHITAAEYDNLITEVSGSGKYAASEDLMNTSPTYGWSNNTTLGGSNSALKVPASNYIIAWSVRTGGSSASSFLGSKLKVSSSQTADYVDYGPSLPNISDIAPNTRVYFVLKKPTTSTPGVPSYTAVFTANLLLGNSVSFLSVAEYYVAGDGAMLSLTVGADSYSQVISTPTLQW